MGVPPPIRIISKSDALDKKGKLKKNCRMITAKNGKIMYLMDIKK